MVVVLVRNSKRTLSLRMNIPYAFPPWIFALICCRTSALFYKEVRTTHKLRFMW